jgi:hypothetical protein
LLRWITINKYIHIVSIHIIYHLLFFFKKRKIKQNLADNDKNDDEIIRDRDKVNSLSTTITEDDDEEEIN